MLGFLPGADGVTSVLEPSIPSSIKEAGWQGLWPGVSGSECLQWGFEICSMEHSSGNSYVEPGLKKINGW